MVTLAAILFSSDVGTETRGGAVSVNVAEGVLEGALWDQRKPRVQQGLFNLSLSILLRFLPS